MTPTDEATFIALWTAGTETSEIAERLGIPKGTVQSRAHRLRQRGLIQPRPRGRVLSESAGAGPAGGNPTPTREAPAITMVAVPELWELITRFSGLEARVAALEDGTCEATRTPPVPTSPPAGTRTPGTIKQWTVRLSQPLIEAVKAQAMTEGKEPSHLVEQLLWTALTDRRASTP